MRYQQIEAIVGLCRPGTIVEVGVFKGERSELICREALKYRDKVRFRGYDVFDTEDHEFHKKEFNGKGIATREEVEERLSLIPGVEFDLITGRTSETLHGKNFRYDLAFIDGGHTVETIAKDLASLWESKVIILDDYYTGGPDTTKVGCNNAVQFAETCGKRALILPRKDGVSGGGFVQMVVLV